MNPFPPDHDPIDLLDLRVVRRDLGKKKYKRFKKIYLNDRKKDEEVPTGDKQEVEGDEGFLDEFFSIFGFKRVGKLQEKE